MKIDFESARLYVRPGSTGRESASADRICATGH